MNKELEVLSCFTVSIALLEEGNLREGNMAIRLGEGEGGARASIPTSVMTFSEGRRGEEKYFATFFCNIAIMKFHFESPPY